MSRLSVARHRRRKKREQRVAERTRRTGASPVRSRVAPPAPIFPSFVYDSNGAPDEFVELVRAAVGTIRLDDPADFPPIMTRLLAVVGRIGVERLVFGLVPRPERGKVQGVIDATLIRLGQAVFARIPEDRLLRYIPLHDVLFVFRGRSVRAHFRSLCRAAGRCGTVYHSPHRPTLEVGGRRLVVGFSAHAIRQACERVVPTWRAYTGLGDAFALFDQCLEFERQDLADGQLALTFFENCRPGMWSGAMAEQILAGGHDPTGQYAYRIGYCPAAIDGEFVVAKTLLFPGYRQTPERARLVAHAVNHAERARLVAEAEGLGAARLWETQDFGILRWFHDHGVPQIVPRRVRYAKAIGG